MDEIRETEEQRRDIPQKTASQLAAEFFGDKFKGDVIDSSGEPVERDEADENEDTRHEPLTLDEATDRIQVERDEAADLEAERAGYGEDEGADALTDGGEPDDGADMPEPPVQEAVWTTQDLTMLTQLKDDVTTLERDRAVLHQYKATVNIGEIERMDPTKARAVRVAIREVEQSLESRENALREIAGHFQAVVQNRSAKAMKGHVDRESAKVTRAFPDYEPEKTAKFLQGYGFADEQINALSDSRLIIIAEQARRYREMTKGQTRRKGFIPTKGSAKAKGGVRMSEGHEQARERFEQTRNVRDAAELRGWEREEGRPDAPAAKPTVRELRRAHQKEHSIDSAVALMRAKREAQARRRA